MSVRRLSITLIAAALPLAGLLIPTTAEAAAPYRNPPSKSHKIKRPAAGHLVSVHGFAHRFDNFDYDGGNKIDNPVTMVFVSKRPNMVERVYDQLDSVGIDSGGSKMTLSGWGPSRSGVGNTAWHSHSAGRKGAFGCWGHCSSKTDIHVRTYGPDGRKGTQVYQGSRGYAPYYLVATVHFDANENTSKATFGYNDRARYYLVNHMVARHTWHVKASVTVPGSSCYGWFDNSHFCDSNGKAQVISID